MFVAFLFRFSPRFRVFVRCVALHKLDENDEGPKLRYYCVIVHPIFHYPGLEAVARVTLYLTEKNTFGDSLGAARS